MWQHTYGPPQADGDSCSWARHKCKWACWCHVQTQIHMLSKHSILHRTAAAFNHPWAMAGYVSCGWFNGECRDTKTMSNHRDEQADRQRRRQLQPSYRFVTQLWLTVWGCHPKIHNQGFNLLQQSVPRPTLAGFEAIRSAGRRSEEHPSLPTLTSGGEAEGGRLRRDLLSFNFMSL